MRRPLRVALIGFTCYSTTRIGNSVSWRTDTSCDLKPELGFGTPIGSIPTSGVDTKITPERVEDFLRKASVPGAYGPLLPELNTLVAKRDGVVRIYKREVDYYVVGKLTPYRQRISAVGFFTGMTTLIPHMFSAGVFPMIEQHRSSLEVVVFDAELNQVFEKMFDDSYWTYTSWFATPNGRRPADNVVQGIQSPFEAPPSNAWVPSVMEASGDIRSFLNGIP